MKVRFGYIVVLASLALAALAAGCSKPDPTIDAAPPPGPNARPEPNGGVKKNMPGNAPMNMGGGAAGQAGPAQKP